MSKKLGTLIKEARTGAGLTQEQLAKKVKGLTAADISKAERGETEPTKEELKAIAKATGVTQKSLTDAMKKTSAKTSSTGKTASSAKAKTASTDLKLTEAEKKLVRLYRKANSTAKKQAVSLLEKSQETSAAKSAAEKVISDLITNAINNIGKDK